MRSPLIDLIETENLLIKNASMSECSKLQDIYSSWTPRADLERLNFNEDYIYNVKDYFFIFLANINLLCYYRYQRYVWRRFFMARNKYPEETIKLIVNQSLKLFIEKGYENTSIQDIINNLGGLSKGAIYHHFKSKEEIFEAVCKKIGDDNTVYYRSIRDSKDLSGYEKLKVMVQSAYSNPNNEAVVAMTSKIGSDPKFLLAQITDIFEVVAPLYIQPVIEEGIMDGSIQTKYPKELSEVIIVLVNIWINPIIAKTTPEEMKQKLEFFSCLLQGIGLNLLDQETISQYVEYCKNYVK